MSDPWVWLVIGVLILVQAVWHAWLGNLTDRIEKLEGRVGDEKYLHGRSEKRS